MKIIYIHYFSHTLVNEFTYLDFYVGLNQHNGCLALF